jgi:hypothetical protein
MINVGRSGIVILLLLSSVPVFAQVDFSGDWSRRVNEDGATAVGEYMGIPINESARLRGDAWQPSEYSQPEFQCRPHGGFYIWHGQSNLRISKELDPVTRQIIGFHTEWDRSVDTLVYLDGRPHPSPNAVHTWGGFATAKWDGDTLVVTRTHLKENYTRRNGMPISDKATVSERWFRHGDFLTIATIAYDPVYLTEPYIRTSDFELDVHRGIVPAACVIVEELDKPASYVPHWLPGENPDLHEFADKHGIPYEATRGGAETMYPDYRFKVKELTRNSVRK